MQTNNFQQPNNDNEDTGDMLASLARILPLAVILSGCVIYIQQISSEVAVLKARQELNSVSTRESLVSLKEDMQELKDLIRQKEIRPNGTK